MSATRADADPGAPGSRLPLLVGAGGFAALVLAGGRLLRDPDCHFHVAAGRWMIARRALPEGDVFSHTRAGAPWTAHEWLAEILFAVAHDLGGWSLVVALTAAAAGLALYGLAAHLARWLPARHVVFHTVFAMLVVAPHLHARPHALVLPCLTLFACELGAARAEARAPRARWVLLVVLWANLHGSFLLATGLALAFGLEALLAAGAATRASTLRGWGGFVALSAAAGMVTPHGPGGLGYVLGFLRDGRTTGFLHEWQPPDLTTLQPITLWLVVFVGGGLALRMRVPPVRLALVVGLVYLALRHTRHGELLGLLAPIVLAPSLGAALPGGRRDAYPRLAAPGLRRLVPIAIGLALYATGISRVVTAKPARATTPAGALHAVRAAGVTGPVLNAYGFGGYLVASGHRTFIDLRTDLFGAAFFEAYMRGVVDGDDKTLDTLLERHHITWTLLQPGMPAVARLDQEPTWSRLYTDDVSVVHVRQRSLPD